MNWDLKEAIDHYRRQGAPGDQNALRNLLTEIQEESGGVIPRDLLGRAAEGLGVKESFLVAIIRRIPRRTLTAVVFDGFLQVKIHDCSSSTGLTCFSALGV